MAYEPHASMIDSARAAEKPHSTQRDQAISDGQCKRRHHGQAQLQARTAFFSFVLLAGSVGAKGSIQSLRLLVSSLDVLMAMASLSEHLPCWLAFGTATRALAGLAALP